MTELGIFIKASVPSYLREEQPAFEHRALMNDIEAAIAADRAGFKYVWAAEHHFLDEYSHLSANSVVLSYLAHATTRIHLGSGIFNPLPKVIHPAKLAETVAMLDHLTNNRFEFGTGRGAGSHEILGFLPGMTDLTRTREIWEDVIGELPKMWMNDIYPGYEGRYWSLPERQILPKPYGPGHPAMWYAAGNATSYEMAARRGLGVLGFSISSLRDLGDVITGYKKAITESEPVGAFVNDNVLVAIPCFVSEDESAAIETACDPRIGYQNSLTFRYHDTFPRPAHVPPWPEVLPATTPDRVPALREAGVIIGDPDHAIKQLRRWEAAGADQVVMGTGQCDHAATMETIRLLGEHVIPKIDTDPVHRTTRFRARTT